VSISLGSSRRNHKAEVDFSGIRFTVERIGTDGDMGKMIAMIKELDGQVDAFGLGGIDLYIGTPAHRYTLRDGKKIVRAAKKTPIVDGSGLKDTLERLTVNYLENLGWDFKDKKVLLISAMDRWGMAETLADAGCQLEIGDFIFALGIPWSLRKLKSLDRVARVVAPIAVMLPFSVLYPTGNKQDSIGSGKFGRYFTGKDIIAGDFNYIYKHMPADMGGQVVITNTVTVSDVEELRRRGVKTLITTTPVLSGRSFGTNAMEALLVAYAGADASLSSEAYHHLLSELKFVPRIEHLQEQECQI